VEHHFGPVGIVCGQTIRINVVNTSVSAHHACLLVLSFLDSTGKRIGDPDVQILESDQVQHLDLNADSLELAPW